MISCEIVSLLMTIKEPFLIRVPFSAGVHFNAATLHRQQRETAKAKGEVTRKKECVPFRTGEEKCEAITETERKNEKRSSA